VKFARQRVTRENLDTLLRKYLKAGDLLIDLAWNIDCCEILQWCHDRGVLYVNTSVELWDPTKTPRAPRAEDDPLLAAHEHPPPDAKWSKPGPSAVLEHGANPGLISHFTRQGLIDIGNRAIKDKKVVGAAADEIRWFIAEKKFNFLALKLA